MGLQVVGIGLFLLCGQTVLSLLTTAPPSGGGVIPVRINETTKIATLTYTCSPRNSGFLAATAKIGFGLRLTDGSYNNMNSTTINLAPGGSEVVDIRIKVPVSVLNEYYSAKGSLDIYTDLRTLWGLVGIEYDALTEGG